MKYISKTTAVLLTVIMLISAIPFTVFADIDHRAIYDAALEYVNGLGTPAVGSVGGEWMVIGLTRSGYPCPDGYYENVVEYVKAKINDKQQLHRSKGTDNSRVILALTSAGYDVTDVAEHNLLMGLTDMTYVKKQGVNGPIWALIAFDCNNYDIPLNPDASEQVTREGLIGFILSKQLEDGGWALSGKSADPDMTGMAVQSLARYYDADNRVREALDRALECLSEIQKADGGYGSIDGICSESCAQVIVALTSLGIDPETDSRFIKNGASVVDAMCSFAVEGGGFAHNQGGALNGMATEQASYALASYFRFLEGKTSLYDMSDVFESADDSVDTDDTAEDETTALPDDTTSDETGLVPDDTTREPEETLDGGIADIPDSSVPDTGDDTEDIPDADTGDGSVGGFEEETDEAVTDDSSNVKPNSSTVNKPSDSSNGKPNSSTGNKPSNSSNGKTNGATGNKQNGSSNNKPNSGTSNGDSNKNTGTDKNTENKDVSSVNKEDIPQTADNGLVFAVIAATIGVVFIYSLSVKQNRKHHG